MAGARLGNLFACRLGLRLERAYLRAIGFGPRNPVFQGRGLRPGQFQPGHIQRVQRADGLVNQHLELLLGEANVLARFNLLRQRHVKTCLRLVHIGTNAGTGGKNLACRLKLGFIESLLCQHQRELFGGQHGFKISRRHPHDQVLLLLRQHGLRIIHQRLGLTDLGLQHRAVQRLAHRKPLAFTEVAGPGALVTPQETRRGAGQIIASVREVGAHIGQQLCPCLGQPLLAGLGGGAGGQNVGVLQFGCFIGLQQVQRPGHHRKTEQHRAHERGFDGFGKGFQPELVFHAVIPLSLKRPSAWSTG